MNVFSKYTIETLKKNRTRTIVTIIGIILSVAMFTAVTESIVSGQQYLINSVIHNTGSFNGTYNYVSNEQLQKLEKDDTYKEIAKLQNIGYAKVKSRNTFKPYLFIAGIDDDFTDMVAVNLIEGRMPEKEGEIVLSRHLYTDGRIDYKVGDVLTLEVGQRESADGEYLNSSNEYMTDEKLVDISSRAYTVVGICERADQLVEYYECPGYTAYTLKENNQNLGNKVFFTVNNPSDWYKKSADIAKEAGIYDVRVNTDLLIFEGFDIGASILSVVYGLGAILILIIMFGSIALIYNSFSISISERTKQFGLLRSIGATKKQMTKTVLSESLFLCAVAVPIGLLSGCLGIGVTFRLLSNQFTTIIGEEINTNGAVTMKLVPNVYALLAAALISIFTALISAYIPVKRAMKMSAIEAIRMSNDVRIKGKQLKTSKISDKLFGFEGKLAQKNFKRNKKKYRTTVISLAMSLILFISASSLCFYFQKTVNMDMNEVGYDIIAMSNPNVLSNEQTRAAIEEIGRTDGIDDSALVAEWDTTFIAKVDDVNKVVADKYLDTEGGYVNHVVARYFVNDEAFNKVCRENGLEESDYYNKSEPMALLYDKFNFVFYDEETEETEYYQESVFEAKKFPATLNVIELEEKKNGAVCNGVYENGKVIYSTFEDNSYVNVENCIASQGVKVGAKLQQNPFFLNNSSVVIMYPESMMDSVCVKKPEHIYYHGYYKAENYNSVYEEMLKIADSYDNGVSIENESEGKDTIKALMTLIRVFSYGFITLISLVAAANVFNTISTNIMLRRREFAMLKSVGMSNKGFRKMMSYESLLYGVKSILIGLPISLVITYVIYYIICDDGYKLSFTLPYGNIIFALVSVFIVVASSMIYSVKKLKKYNTAEELKNENL